MDRFAKYNAIAAAMRGQVCELELVTPLTLPDKTVQEITHVRRAVCKKVSRKRNSTVLEFADIDRSALEQPFPFETFTVSDFPEIFVDHVGRRVPQGVGTVLRVPLTYIHQSAGQYIYAGHKVLGGNTGNFLTVYRGTQPGQGAVVPPAEYSTTTMTAKSGYTVWCIVFAQQQVDFSGAPYVIEADISLPGSRAPSAEISRILQAYGLTVDAATFTAAAAADIAAGFLVDALYGDPGRTGSALLADLLQIARGWLIQTSTGAWSLVQDVAKASVAQYDTSADPIEISEYGDGDIVKTVSVYYGPKASADDGNYAGLLVRTTSTGASGDHEIKLLYVQDANTADRLACYWQKRMNSLRLGKAIVHAAQHNSGDVVTVSDQAWWAGAKNFIITGISRLADANSVVLREYDAAVYVYTPAALPAAATNGYLPDFSFTRPLAPTSLALVSQGTSADTDGKVTAFQKVHASPPADTNWASLWVQLTDTTTNEQYTQQLFLNGGTGFYEAVFSGLRPSRIHSIIAWARNATNVDGVTATLANFTTANATTALNSPVLSLSQKQSFEINIDFTAIADVAGQPKFRRYVLFENVAGAGYNEVQRTPDRTLKRTVVHGTSYQYKGRSEDVNGNESADSASVNIIPVPVVSDNWISPGGVGNGSLGNGSVSRIKEFTSTGSASVTVSTGTIGGVTMEYYTFAPSISSNLGNLNWGFPNAAFADDQGHVSARNTSGANDILTVQYRYIQP